MGLGSRSVALHHLLFQRSQAFGGQGSGQGVVSNPLFQVSDAAFELGNAKSLFSGRGIKLPRQLVALCQQALGFGQSRQQRRDIYFPPGQLLGLFRERGLDIRDAVIARRKFLA